MICSESPSNNNAKWPIKSGAVDPELRGFVVLGIYVFCSFIITFRFQALDESFHMPNHLFPHCGSSYQNISWLKEHVNAKPTGTLKYRCNTCDHNSTEKHQLEAHLIKHGGDKVMCSVCDKNFTTTFLLRRHIVGAHENIKHQCRTGRLFSRIKMYLNSMFLVYTIRSIDINCVLLQRG